MVRENVDTGLEIAVISMSGRFPGAKTINDFWANLKNGVESISFLSDEEVAKGGVGSGLNQDPCYVKSAGGVLEDIEYFDAAFFDYTPMETEKMAPQIRVFHECLWEVLEDAGYDPTSFKGLIGLYTGASSTRNWQTLCDLSPGASDLSSFVSNYLSDRDYISTVVSYKLNLKGPSFSMHTACSTSLVAIHLACQGLLSGDCSMALAGGINLSLSKKVGYVYAEGMIFSPDGHCRSFDANAGGTIGSDGIGIAALKRLEDALVHRDHIYAVIKGSAINNDGSQKVGFAAPGIDGQAGVIRKALKMANVDPLDITYVETHGTGTVLGDVTEIEALKLAFNTRKKHFCALGSVKTNVGHMDTAAGAAGFIKTVLALKHKQIPPSLHFETPNPGVDFENSPFYVNTTLKQWKTQGKRLRAGVSSFGIGGTNAHVVLEEWSEDRRQTINDRRQDTDDGKQATDDRKYQLILLSAKTQNALDRMTRNMADHLKKNPGIDLADAAYTLQVGRRRFPCRRKLACGNVSEAIDRLSAVEPGNVQTYQSKVNEGNKPVIFMFSGLGSQYVNMGRGLYETEPLFHQEMDRCFRMLNRLLDYDIKEILYPDNGMSEMSEVSEASEERFSVSYRSYSSNRSYSSYMSNINQADNAQLVVFIFEYALAKLLIKWGIKPRSMIGYSFGEYAAACISGIFSLEDALKLLVSRGNLLRQLPAGMMLSVPLPVKEAAPLLNNHLSIGIDNGESCVVAGPVEAVKLFEKQMKEKKMLCLPLDSTHGVHSRMIEPILEEFQQQVSVIPLHSPQIPYISSVTGSWLTLEDAVSPVYWAKQLRETVHFARGIQKLLKEPGTIFLEVGAGHEICALVKRQMEMNSDSHQHQHHTINLVRHPKNQVPDDYYLVDKLGLLWLYGGVVDWSQYHQAEERYRISLPTYPFEKKRFWKLVSEYESGQISMKYSPSSSIELSHWFYAPYWKCLKILRTGKQEKLEGNWLIFMDQVGLGDRLVHGLKSGGILQQQIVTVRRGPEYRQQEPWAYTINPEQYGDYRELLAKLDSGSIIPNKVIHLWGITNENRDGTRLEVIEREQELGFYSLLYLARALGNCDYTRGIEIHVVTDHMQEVTGDEDLHPGKATVLGPCRVIPQEYPGITCKSIDLTEVSDLDEAMMDYLLAEMVRRDDTAVAFRHRRRWVQSFEPMPLEKPKASPLTREGGVYLILGGLGDIGYTLAEYLIQQVNAKVILTGRTQLPPQEMWNQYLIMGDKTDKTYQKILKLQRIQELGGEVLYINANAVDGLEMAEAIRIGEERFGPLNGVIHSAGIIKGDTFNTINALAKPVCQEQFKAKLYGLLVLEDLIKDKELDFCLMISSISTVLGGLKFAAYSAANHFLDAFSIAHNRKKREPWIIVDWDGTDKKNTTTAFHRFLSLDSVEQVVFSNGGDLEKRIARWVKLEGIGKEDKEKQEAAPLYSRPGLSNPYVAPGNAAEQTLANIWQRFFGIDRIGITDDLFDLGGDSLKMINLIAIIQKELKVTIPLKEFFDNPTIENVARYIIDAEKEEYISIEPVEKKEFYVVTSGQKRLYLLQQMDKENIAYNTPLMVQLEGRFFREHLEQVMCQSIQRHEILRTSFEIVNETPVQRVHDQVEFKFEYYDSQVTGAGSRLQVKEVIHHFIRAFDLSRAPCFRIGLIPIEETRHILMFDIHHIITDGIAHEIFVRELETVYASQVLTLPRLQYKDYAEWLNSPRQQAALKKQEAYWLEQFQAAIPVLNLPTDYARPTVQDFEGSTMEFNIGKEETQQLKKLAAREDVTLYMVLLALFDVFLAKISSQEDVVVGTGVAGRRHPDMQNIMGMFVNTLAIRNFPNSWKSFRQFLQEIKTKTLESFENQEYPFEELVEKVNIKRDTSRNPIFDTMLMLQNVDVQEERETSASPASSPVHTLDIKPYGYDSRISKFDFTLFVQEVEGRLSCYFEYCSKLFKPKTITWFVTYFKEIALSASNGPDKSLLEIEKISPKRKERIIRQLNQELKEESRLLATAMDTPELNLDRSFIAHNHRTAIEYGEQTLSYGELNRLSDNIANWIINKGIPAQTFIGILLENRVDVIMVLLGILKARCVFVPLDSSYPRKRLENMIAAAGIQLMVTDNINYSQWLNSMIDMKPDQPRECFLMDHLVSPGHRVETAPEVVSSPDDIIYIYFTSGTTGTPRAMEGRNRSLTHFIHWEINTFNVNERYRFSQFTIPVFDAFLRDVFVPLCAGGVICIPGSKETLLHSQQLIHWLERQQISLIHCVPALFRLLSSREYPAGNHFKELKYILLSGEPVNPSVLNQWYESVGDGIQLFNLWGTSETTLAKTCYPIQPADIHRERVPVGKPLPGTRVVVLDENLDLCDPLVTGEIYIKTPFRTYGYCNEPELNYQRFIPDPFTHDSEVVLHKTGDLGRILTDGSIDVIGRNDRQVKIRGIRVEPEEIESVTMTHPEVCEAVVMKKEISTTNELLCVYITVTPHSPLTGDTLLKRVNHFLREKLPDYMVPGKLIILERLPRTPTGKVNYDALPDPLLPEQPEVVLPRDRIEEKLMEFWTSILVIDNLGVTQSFFELGGNSLNIMTLISRIHKEFDVRISLGAIFNHPTIETQARIIRHSAGDELIAADKYVSIKSVEKKAYYDVSYAQRRVWVLSRIKEASMAFNMPIAIVLLGELHREAFAKAFAALAVRHESLRTLFISDKGNIKQKILSPREMNFRLEYIDLLQSESNARERKTKAKELVKQAATAPFDLSQGPLLRARLLRLENRYYLFLFNMHHIIGDFLSNEVLTREVFTLYNAFRADEPNPLPPLRIHYKDYTAWQNRQLNGEYLQKHRSYWLSQFEIPAPQLLLHTDKPRPQIQGYKGDVKELAITGSLVNALKELSQQHDATLFMTMLAALNVLLFHYTGQTDIVIGTPIAGRQHADLEGQIGFYLNTLALRTRFNEGDSFGQLLAVVKKMTLAAFQHQAYPFDKLIKDLGEKREISRHPLFDVMVDMQEASYSQLPDLKGNLRIDFYETGQKSCKFDLTFYIVHSPIALNINFEYNIDLFHPETIERMARRFRVLLESIAGNPHTPIVDFKLEKARKMPTLRPETLQEYLNEGNGKWRK